MGTRFHLAIPAGDLDKAIKLSINNDVYKLLKSEIYINKFKIDEAIYILEELNNNRIKKDKNSCNVRK